MSSCERVVRQQRCRSRMVYEYVQRVQTHVSLSFSKQTYAVIIAVSYVGQDRLTSPACPQATRDVPRWGGGGEACSHEGKRCLSNNTLGNIKMAYQRRFCWSNRNIIFRNRHAPITRITFYKKLKNVSCEYDRVNG